MLNELLYADNLVLMSEITKGLGNKFIKWKEVFYSKRLKVSLGKTEVMLSSRITKDGLSKSKFDPSKVCSLRVKPKTVL